MLQYRGHACFESVRPDIILRSLHYLKLNNSLYDNIEEDVKIIPSFLVEEKRCDSLPLVALNNTNIDDKIPVIVENYSSGAEAKGVLLSIPNKNIQLMLKFLKAPFLVIKFSYYTLMTFLVILSVIFLLMLMILLSALSMIRLLICGNN